MSQAMIKLKDIFLTSVVCLHLRLASSFIVTKENPALPVAFADGPEYRFVRVQPNNEVKYIKCPKPTVFDQFSLTCIFPSKRRYKTKDNINNRLNCRDLDGAPVMGAVPDFQDCRYFYLCGPGTATRTPCSVGLLFNKDISNCDWPKDVNCCEFPGEDPLKLVVPQAEYLISNI